MYEMTRVLYGFCSRILKRRFDSFSEDEQEVLIKLVAKTMREDFEDILDQNEWIGLRESEYIKQSRKSRFSGSYTKCKEFIQENGGNLFTEDRNHYLVV